MPESPEAKRHAGKIVRELKRLYPVAECALEHRNAFELVIATILSAQCTDARVNIVTRDLFQSYPTPQAFAAAKIEDIERAIQSTGFFRNKAKSIKACCEQLIARYGGEVPRTLDELTQLAGVGRKTANVVLGVAFQIPSGVVVDTHVGRLSRRLGLTEHHDKDAVRIERDLNRTIAKSEWIGFSHRLILHGRGVCAARKPLCDICTLAKLCPREGVLVKPAVPKKPEAKRLEAKKIKRPAKRTAVRGRP